MLIDLRLLYSSPPDVASPFLSCTVFSGDKGSTVVGLDSSSSGFSGSFDCTKGLLGKIGGSLGVCSLLSPTVLPSDVFGPRLKQFLDNHNEKHKMFRKYYYYFYGDLN